MCLTLKVDCVPGAPHFATPRNEFRALVSAGGAPDARFFVGTVPGVVSAPLSEAPVPPTVGTGSSGSYDIINRPTTFPIAVSHQGQSSSSASAAPPSNPFAGFSQDPTLFLLDEYNRVQIELTRLYYKRASLAAAIRSTTNWVVPPSPPFLAHPPVPPVPEDQ